MEDLITSEDFEALDVIGDNIYLLAETVIKKEIHGYEDISSSCLFFQVSPPTYMTGGVSFFVTKQEGNIINIPNISNFMFYALIKYFFYY